MFYYIKATKRTLKVREIIHQAEQAIGSTITTKTGIAPAQERAINTALETINNYINNHRPLLYKIKLYVLKAQLLQKLLRSKSAEHAYNQAINFYQKYKIHFKEDKIILAQAYIGKANLLNQKISALQENLNNGIGGKIDSVRKVNKRTSTLYRTEDIHAKLKFQSHIHETIKLLPNDINTIKKIMEKFYWPDKQLKNETEQTLNDIDNKNSDRSFLSRLLYN